MLAVAGFLALCLAVGGNAYVLPGGASMRSIGFHKPAIFASARTRAGPSLMVGSHKRGIKLGLEGCDEASPPYP